MSIMPIDEKPRQGDDEFVIKSGGHDCAREEIEKPEKVFGTGDSCPALKNENGRDSRFAGNTRHMIESKPLEEEHHFRLRFLESMERVDRVIRESTDIEQMMKDVIEAVFSIYGCDRAWLLFPCDPDASSFKVPIEITRPEYPGALALNKDVPMVPSTARDFREALNAAGPLTHGPGCDRPMSEDITNRFSVQTQMVMAVYPRLGKPWIFGMHQCAYARIWTEEERTLFKEIGRRISDGLSSMLFLKQLQESEEKLKATLASMDDLVFVLDKYGIFTDFYQPPDRRDLYVPAKEFLGKSFKDVLPQHVSTLFDDAISDLIASGNVQQVEYSLDMPDGEKSYHAKLSMLRDAVGRFTGLTAVVRDITEQKKAEEEILEWKNRYEAAVLASGHLLYDWDSKTNNVTYGDNIKEILGYNKKEMQGGLSHWMSLIHPEDRACFEKEIENLIEMKEPALLEYRVRKKDGEYIFVENEGYFIADALGKKTRMVGFVKDITERKRSEEVLRKNADYYQTITSTSMDGFAITDMAGRILDVNEAYSHMIGYSRDELLKMSVSDIEANHTPDQIEAQHQKILAGTDRFESRHRRKDGRIIDVEISMTHFPHTGHVLIFLRDITKRKMAEEALRNSEEKYRTLVDNIGIGVSLISKDMEILTINKQVREWFPLIDETKNPICYRAFNDPPRDEICSYCPTQKTLTDGLRHEAITETPAGNEVRNYRIISSPIKDKNGNTVSAIEILEDITERKQAEESLKEAYDIISKSPAVAFLWKNEEGWPVEFVSPNVETVFGFTDEEFVSKKISYSKTIHADDLEKVTEEISIYSRQKASTHFKHEPYRIVTKAGDVKWVDDRTYIRRNDEGGITHYQGIVEDITDKIIAQEEKITLEKQLQQAQKMEALGTLAGGVAHDFNNILGGIIGYTELAQDSLPDDWPAHRDLDKVLDASGRAKELVDHILAFSRQSKTELRPLRISIIAKEAVKLLRASLPTTIEIRKIIKAESEIVRADPTQIHQLVMNLCTNAGHAMRDTGGILEVELTVVHMGETEAAAIPDLTSGPFIKLTISDTGHGMSPDVLERIFDPYFTTKEKGEGTGLGLAVVHGIVKSHGGTITVDSKLGKGTNFHIYLPRIEEGDETAPEKTAISSLPTGHEHILIVDDEPALVDIGKRTLESLGYSVEARISCVEALELFRKASNRFDLVITDQTMPNMTGTQLAVELLNIRPDIPIILCTGFSELTTEEKARDMGIRGYINKPVKKEELAKTIREVLDK